MGFVPQLPETFQRPTVQQNARKTNDQGEKCAVTMNRLMKSHTPRLEPSWIYTFARSDIGAGAACGRTLSQPLGARGMGWIDDRTTSRATANVLSSVYVLLSGSDSWQTPTPNVSVSQLLCCSIICFCFFFILIDNCFFCNLFFFALLHFSNKNRILRQLLNGQY